MILLLKGIILGFSIAAPVGPIGVLCIRRTLAQGMLIGFISGLGAATADAIYGLLAAISVSVITVLLLKYQFYLHFIGGIFLLYLGYKTFKAIPAKKDANVNSSGYLSAYASTFLLTITNPLTIMSFAGVFAGVGVTGENYFAVCFLVAGVFLGSLLWWFVLSGTVSRLRHNFTTKNLSWVNRLSGMIIIAFGIASLLS